MDLGLEGRPALVAAASRGIGRACAEALAREGARVAICSRNGDAVWAAAEAIGEAAGREVVPVVADVSTAEGAAGFVREGAQAVGGCQVLVTNAGGPPPGPLERFTDQDIQRALELNFLSVVRMIREALPHMRAAGYGRIVHIGSSAMKEPIDNLGLSNAARSASTGYLRTLARELAPEGITVNAVLPGRILTDRTRELAESSGRGIEEEIAAASSAIPMGRLGRPEEVGGVVAFLASERASFVTGVMLSVDGGLARGLL